MDKSVENFQESNFHYNTYSDTTNNHQLVLQSEDLFSSEEESTSEVGSLISEFSEEDQSELEEFINIDYDISENTRENLAAKIIEMHCKLKSRQDKIDKNEKFKSGRGRKRHSPFKTSAELRNFIIEYIENGLSKILNSKSKERKDANLKSFLRLLKKLPLYLIENCGPVNKYKSHNLIDNLAAYSESHSSFLFSINKFDESKIMKSFVEFIIIYFPENKVENLIYSLIQQNPELKSFLNRNQGYLQKRDICSKRNIREWASSSTVFSNILELARDVLKGSKFEGNRSCQDLKVKIDQFLNHL